MKYKNGDFQIKRMSSNTKNEKISVAQRNGNAPYNNAIIVPPTIQK